MLPLSPPLPSTRRLERVFSALALVCLGFWSWAWLDKTVYGIVRDWRLESILGTKRHDSSRPPNQLIAAATRNEVAASGLIGRIAIPRFRVHSIVAEGTDARTLNRAVGHVPRTAFPGEPGNVVIAGHRDAFFSYLKGVRLGDRVRMTTPDGVFDYRIDSRTVVQPEQTEVLSATNVPTLTLITCYPFHYLGPAPERYVVRARQVATSAEPPSRVSHDESLEAFAPDTR
jgi:sortase A